MVCVPCILLPILLAIYIKFIQPIIFRLLPESWKTTFDALLYPTCPIPATNAQADKTLDGHDQGVKKVDDCGDCPDNSKKHK